MAERFNNTSKARSLATGKQFYGKWWSLVGLLQEAGRYKFVLHTLFWLQKRKKKDMLTVGEMM